MLWILIYFVQLSALLVSSYETRNIICNLLCTYAILSPCSQKLFPLLFFCVLLIPISLYNLLSSPERRNSSLFCFSSQPLSCPQGWLKSEKCIRVHINSVRFAYFSHKPPRLFSSFAINSMTKQKMLLLYTVRANTSLPVVFSCIGKAS